MKKIKQKFLAPNQVDLLTVRVSEPGSSVALKDEPVIVRRARLTVSNKVLSVTEALDYGSVKLCDLPFRNMLLLAVEANLTVVKGGVTDGIVAATDLDMAIGTAAASATTLATTMIDIIEKKDLDADALSVTFAGHSNDNATSVFPFKLADSATAALYLNAVAVGGIAADDTLTVSGTVDIYYLDVGKAA